MQLPRTILFFSCPLIQRICLYFMKIIGSRFRLRGRRQPQALPAEEKAKEEQKVEVKIKKRALLIGVCDVPELSPTSALSPVAQTPLSAVPKRKSRKRSKTKKMPTLKGPHADVVAMKDLLIETYQYDPDDIMVLIDDTTPGHLQPTRENILVVKLRAIANLIHGARENDRFFFYFAGHSKQEDTDDIEEEDRKNEFMLCSDGLAIQDDELRTRLVNPLPPKSSLIAVFDSCNSGTLLDLKHFRCNQVYVPWLNRGDRRTKSMWYQNQRQAAKISTRAVQQFTRINTSLLKWTQTSIDQLMMSPAEASTLDVKLEPVVNKKKTSISIITDRLLMQEPSSWFDSAAPRCASPEMLYCSGDCRDNPLFERDGSDQADVISLSSAGDSQRAWEGADGTSMTQALVQLLRNDPHPTLHNLLTHVSHDLHRFYLNLHVKAREYRKMIEKRNEERKKKGKKPKLGDVVEMNNFQNPQLSSDRPLDMSRTWYP
ncbi:hypothetical protein NLJ89_g5898 [Agrocybe chaxingu]|uniref:Peptidase C14 caspase domain-containing protein n=1 Tax=Agrocybe chaxingu TaxID=84603 RepID=A0A9W8K071_9AGAR|nr:hypothetical protein NLJ89_g5898 [Agrocybe chaxingu]